MIKGYPKGSNITVINTSYQYPKRIENDKGEKVKYSDDIMTILYKDLDTGEKKIEEIHKPHYTFFKSKDDVYIDHNMLFIDKNDVTEISVPYSNLLKRIAKETNNTEFFYNNIKNGNRRDNEELHTIPTIFNSDMHIEDAYRFYFDLKYRNESFKPTKAYLDIEVRTRFMIGDFPELGECPISAISYIDVEHYTIHVFLLRDSLNSNIDNFEKSIGPELFNELREFMINHANNLDPNNASDYGIDKFRYSFNFYNEKDEIYMLSDLFEIINDTEPDFVLAWNMSFDIPYIIERIKLLGYDPADIMCHPDVENKVAKYYIDAKNSQLPAQRGDFFTILGKSVYLDQLVHFASRRKGQSAFDNLKLDNIGQLIAKIGKLDWSHLAKNFEDFETYHYKTFVFYNIMDTIVQHCIECKVNDIDYVFNKCLINNTRYHKCHRQTIYLTNRGIKEFREDGFIMGNNVNRKNEKPPKFPGALVGDPLNNSDYPKLVLNGEPINICNNLDDFDYKSLYPSIMREFGIAPNTQIGKIEIEQEVHQWENPFDYNKYCRGGQFIQDFCSHNFIEFSRRWFHLAGFKEMLEDMDELYSVKQPFGSRDITQPSRFIKRFDESIPVKESTFILWNDDIIKTGNNSFINRYPEKRDFSEEINILRNTAQYDIDDIDSIMRRREREEIEDKELAELLYDEHEKNSEEEE